MFQGINLKNIQATLLDLVHDMSSQCVLQMYEVSSKYLNGYQVVEQTRFCARHRDVCAGEKQYPNPEGNGDINKGPGLLNVFHTQFTGK